MKHFYIKSFYLLCTLFVMSLMSREFVPGLPAAAPATMPGSILNFVPILNDLADGVFITAGQSGAENFSLAGYSSVEQAFIPYAPQTATLNGTSGPNPLYNSEIDFIAFMSSLPASFFVMPNKNSSEIFFRDARGALLTLPSLPDSTGAAAAGTVGMIGSSIGWAYVAVTTTQPFGQPGSGIVGVIANTDKIMTQSRAVALDTSSILLSLGTSPVTISGDALLSWSSSLKKLYAGIENLTSGVAPTDRAASVVGGLPTQLEAGNIFLTQIVNPAFDLTSLDPSDNYIVIKTGSSVTSAIFHLEAVEMSTQQPVLIVCGRFLDGAEVPADVNNEVYALPLNRVVQGKQQQVVISDQSGYLGKKGATTFIDSAVNASELYTSNDSLVQVGQGPLLASGTVISQLMIQNDTVYAVVNEPLPGIYASQALFDANGLVREWTPWQRAINTPVPIFAAALNTITGTWFMSTSDNVLANTVVRTTWQAGQELTGVAAALMNTASSQPQSITVLNGYDYRTVGMGGVAAFVCTERNQVVLAQTGVLASGSSTFYEQLPDTLYNDVITAPDTRLDTAVGTAPLVVITGGLMSEMAPLTTAAIIHSQTLADTWLCIGGNGGVAVWATDTGAGWGTAFGNDLNQLPIGLFMQTVGTSEDVRLLYADSPFLYVMMPHTISRIDFTNGIANATSTLIAQTGVTLGGTAQQDVITDVLFSQDLGLIATTVGLYRTQTGSSARAANPVWELTAVPESEFPIKTITGYGSAGSEQSLFNGGYCTILSGTARNNRSIVNRIAIEPFGTITDTTVLPFQSDWFIEHIPSFFIDFGEYKDSVSTDGGQYIFARSVEGASPATLLTPNVREILAQPRSMIRFIGRRSIPLRTPLNSDSDIISIVQEPATGAWYVATNKGLIVQG